jgi:hypothetical protein
LPVVGVTQVTHVNAIPNLRVCTGNKVLQNDIPGSRQNPKFVVIDDAEIIGHLIAEVLPFVG